MRPRDFLVDTSRNPLARELLRSADLDEPPEHSVVRLAIALGLSSSAVVSAVATGAAAATDATVGAAIATAAKGFAVAGATAPVAGAAVPTGVATGTGVLSTTIGSTGIGATTAVLSSGAGISAATATAPVVSGALSAVGLLKAMAIVSLTCGALSFGGTKLAMTIAETPTTVASNHSQSASPPRSGAKRTNARAVPAAEPLAAPAAPPPPPALDTQEGADDEVLPALLQEEQTIDAPGVTQLGSPARNVGREDIKENAGARSNHGPSDWQASLATAELTDSPSTGPLRQAAVAAFPSDEEPAAPALNTQPGKKARPRAKPHEVESDADLEREVLLLNRARAAVAGGQPLVALQALDAYRTQARRGALRAESLVLRVKALLALGQRTAAEREAMPFIKAAPQSNQAGRLRELLGVPNDAP